jgi:phage/plasmid-associated DNA primase
VPGGSGAGKSFLIAILMIALGAYVGSSSLSSLKVPPGGKGDTTARRYEFLVALVHCRLALSSEVEDTPGKLDAGIIKAVSGNDVMVMRASYGKEIRTTLDCTFFAFVNDVPEVSSFDASMAERVRTIEFRTSFVLNLSDPPKPNERLRDAALVDRFKLDPTYSDALVHILLDAYADMLANGDDEPAMVKAATADWVGEDASFINRFDKLYQQTDDRDSYVSTDDIRKAFAREFGATHSTKWIKIAMASVPWAEYDKKIRRPDGGYARGFRNVRLA